MASRTTGVSTVGSTVWWGADRRKHKKLRITGFCERNPPVTGGFPSQKAGYVKNVSFDDVIMVKDAPDSKLTLPRHTLHESHATHWRKLMQKKDYENNWHHEFTSNQNP